MIMVRESLYTILDQNQTKHTRLIEKILDHKEMLRTYTDVIREQKQRYTAHVQTLQEMLDKINQGERELVDQLDQINKRAGTGASGAKNVHDDMDNSRASYAVNTKLDKLLTLKKEIMEDMLKTKVMRDNLYFCVDKNLFDNSIMLNEINKNFNSITSIL
jgi:DNA repair exonuclease SbcCD ATPase subunit